jgi:hypothetical protein
MQNSKFKIQTMCERRCNKPIATSSRSVCILHFAF